MTDSYKSGSSNSANSRANDTPSPDSVWTDSLGRAGARSAQTLLIAVVVVGALWLILQVSVVVIAVLVALILASAVHPFVRWLRNHRWPSALATLAAFVSILIVVGGLLTAIVFAIQAEWDELTDSAIKGWDQLKDYLNSGPAIIDTGTIEDVTKKATDFVSSDAFLGGAVSGLGAATEVATGTVLMIVTLFFFLKDGPQIWNFALRWFSGDTRAKVAESGDRTVQVLGNYVRGTAVIATVDAVPVGITMALMGVPLALPLAGVVFLGAFIPIVGATIAGALAALVTLVTSGPLTALVVVGVVIAVNQLEGHLLQPIVMARALNLHALVVLLALAIGTFVGGVFGALLAVPLTAVAWSMIQVWSSAYHSGYDPILGEDPQSVKSRASSKSTRAQRWKYEQIRKQRSSEKLDSDEGDQPD